MLTICAALKTSLKPGSLVALSFVVLTSLGCGGKSDGPELHSVTGTVTFDGAPVEEGRILFRPVSGASAHAGNIKDGKYEIEAVAGEMKVEITASRIIPGKFDTSNPDDEPAPVGEMYIPEKYNSKTELTATVNSDGDNTIPFELTSK